MGMATEAWRASPSVLRRWTPTLTQVRLLGPTADRVVDEEGPVVRVDPIRFICH